MVRPTYVEIDLGAVASNVAAFAGLISPSQVCAVVKADAYGHGDVPVANTALDSGADLLAVALVEEGIRLREAGIQAPVLVLSEHDLESARDLVEWDLTPSVYSATFVEIRWFVMMWPVLENQNADSWFNTRPLSGMPDPST